MVKGKVGDVECLGEKDAVSLVFGFEEDILDRLGKVVNN